MADHLIGGHAFRTLAVVGCHIREAPSIVPRASSRACRVVEVLGERMRGRPTGLRVDNGPEFPGRVSAQ